ncbi:MAG: hypothetical protein ACI9QC_000113 [Oceanicoccus sp.]|jgi:hypothetical protein
MKRILSLVLALSLPVQALACIPVDNIPLHVEIIAAYPQPLENEEEWIELLNTGDNSLDLSHYTLEDSTAKPMTLDGTLAPNDSMQISPLSFQLNNGGDELALYTIEGEFVHSFSYDASESGQSVPLDSKFETEDAPVELSSLPSVWPEYSESIPNPEGTDTTEEWIELFNPYDYAIQIDGLKLDDNEGGSSPFALTGSIEAFSFLLISVEDSKISLNNSTDEIRLLLEEEVLWNVSYTDPEEGLSYALVNGDYQWTTPTPGAKNISNTTEGQVSEEIEITEVNPNPEGPDAENEWIELTNGGDQSVDLGNWSIDDGEGGSDPYIIPEGTIVEPGESIIIERTDSEIALNNSREKVQLYDFMDELMDEIEYESTEEGKSYSKIEVEEVQNLQASNSALGFRTKTLWEWTEPSPGEANPIWKEFVGVVQNFDGDLLTLIHQNSEMIFEALDSNFGELVFQPGNTVMIQASLNQIIRAELLEQVIPNQSKKTPWSWIVILILASGIAAYEWYKYKKQNHIMLPYSKLLNQT